MLSSRHVVVLFAVLCGCVMSSAHVNRHFALQQLGLQDAAAVYLQGQQESFANYPWTVPSSFTPGSVIPSGGNHGGSNDTQEGPLVPTMKQSDAWGQNDWRCTGFTVSTVLSTNASTPYVAPTPEDHFIEDFPSVKQWYYSTAQYWQFINKTGCYTNQGGYFKISGCDYDTQVAGQNQTAVDVSYTRGIKRLLSQDWDVTSCGCAIPSDADFINVTEIGSASPIPITFGEETPLWPAVADPNVPSSHSPSPSHNDEHHGVCLAAWPFMQLFSVNISPVPNPPEYYETVTVAGNVVSEQCVVNPKTPSKNPVPNGVKFYDYCQYNAAYTSANCDFTKRPITS